MELLCYLATMFNIQHYPTDHVTRVTLRLLDLFNEYCGDDYYAEFAPAKDGSIKYLQLVVNREDGKAIDARNMMDFHQFIVVATYHDPILKDMVMFDDFMFPPHDDITVLSLCFDLY